MFLCSRLHRASLIHRGLRMSSSAVKKRASTRPKGPQAHKRPNNTNFDPYKPSAAANKISNINLSDEQTMLKGKILNFINDNLETNNSGKPSVFVINGDAGTGKSAIINAIFNEIQKISRTTTGNTLSGTSNFLVVNHPEMLKLYHQISKQFPYINKSDLERPTSLINRYVHKNHKAVSQEVDVLIIDEAHLLATSKDAFKRFQQDNHLEELLKLSKVVIIVFDDKQSLRMGSFWNFNGEDGASLSEYLSSDHVNHYEQYNLTKQFRVVAQDDLIKWITVLSTKKSILPLPIRDAIDNTFDFKIFESCQEMYNQIKLQNTLHGQSRLLATYDFPYRLDGKDYFVYSQSDDFKLRWDRYLPQITTPWSERDDTIDEVGSVYTIQGFDLNYAGVILGRSIGYNKETDTIEIKPELYDDHAGFTRKKNIKNVDTVKEKIILNSLNVLLTRGVKGLYLFIWDNELRERLLNGPGSDEKVIVRKQW
ncbi:CYFA0S09e01618g1_1 [Cyberlindnera fabianii]|uniref:CYFA0S09e01618g1_1 n=2 Tax=Cyberlindnera fabianii TaxID=36022 RepID=A0A061B5P5_CYBFA|nr:CYFA0S09e01618g1_1 [Cyberlindnera fabianii]